MCHMSFVAVLTLARHASHAHASSTSAAFTLAARTIGKRMHTRRDRRRRLRGSLNCMTASSWSHEPLRRRWPPRRAPRPHSEKTHTLFGPTCATPGLDTCRSPEMSVGDWLIFDDMGAYTTATGRLQVQRLPALIDLPTARYFTGSISKAAVTVTAGAARLMAGTGRSIDDHYCRVKESRAAWRPMAMF
ncbi:hypothetical protein HU200_033948 [Digitaria exilis]|uniref:Orn/DAP/Arg decarboxylase 2 C-terminal domain-containing protein n=1 Tax=Digitaria exilis TaxID=1010633 RepID=A0A835BKX6_9POAL|nr:hypothetical protein HU200_033948 [Digitaria exilis]